MVGPFVHFGDGGGGQAQSGDAGTGIGPDGQVAGHRQWIGRQGAQVHRVAPAGEYAPLGAVDALGIVGEDGLQGVGHPLVGGAQGRRSGGLIGSDMRVAGGGGHGGSPRVDSEVISVGQSCAIKPIIARRTDVGNSLVEVLSGVVRLALIAGVG